jgi:hypothetical protein
MTTIRPGWGYGAIALASLLVCGAVYQRIVAAGGPLEWDESYHALWGLRMAESLRGGHWLTLILDTYRRVYWPPLDAWYLGTLFLVLGPSIELARAASLLALASAALVTFGAARSLARPIGAPATAPISGVIGGLSAALVMLGATGVLTLASTAMLELPGLFWLTVVFALYIRIWSSPQGAGRATYALLGVAIFATYLTKTNYGVLAALAVAGTFLIDGRWLAPSTWRRARTGSQDPGSVSRRGHLWTLLGLALPLAIWLAYPPKIVSTLRLLVNKPLGPERFSLDGLLFYPRDLLWVAGSWPMLLIWLVAFAAACRPSILRSDGRLRLLVLFITIQMVLAELAATKVDRHIVPIVPAIALLVGYWAGRLWRTLACSQLLSPFPLMGTVARLAIVGTLAGLVAWHVSLLQPRLESAGPSPLLVGLTQRVREADSPLVLGSIVLPETPAAIDWHLIVSGVMHVDGAGSLVQEQEQRFAELLGRQVPAAIGEPLRTQIERWPPGTPGSYTAYVGLPLDTTPDYALTPENYGAYVARLLARRPAERILVLFPAQPDPYAPGLTLERITAHLRELGYQPDGQTTAPAETGTVTIAGFTRDR